MKIKLPFLSSILLSMLHVYGLVMSMSILILDLKIFTLKIKKANYEVNFCNFTSNYF